ncbi:acyl-CoA thioesterase [Sneathiella litorea]|uniref:Acyl-CoA thioesterase n=1 Tax=Sneathiella litorea TaxID=2606216 RepID=A0A6L8W8U2_9PROT|nr:thioesterase family protein [Sneathiella litorea]MZR31558.1 acyl-CoA thioesterase [Sneathiella litorea]
MNDVVDLTNKDSFRHWTPVTIRFSDQDPLQHVNNVAYASYFEAARTMFLGGLLDADERVGIDFILARLVIDYLKETHYPNTVDVGARVIKLGTKSITTGYGCFVGDACAATSESVNVFFSTAERKSVGIPDAVRTNLEADPMQEHTKSRYSRNH